MISAAKPPLSPTCSTGPHERSEPAHHLRASSVNIVATEPQICLASDLCTTALSSTRKVRASARSFRPSRLPLRRPLAKAIDDKLWNDEAEAHRYNDSTRGQAVGDCRAQEFECRMRAVGKLQNAARHPEQVHAGNHGNHGGEADGCKRHLQSARDRGQNRADDETGDQCAGRGAVPEYSKRTPP